MPDRLFSDSRLAALYDLFSAGRIDLDFYLGFVMSAASVLDVGCGTGALLHRARELGHRGRLCGLDPAPGMLEQARKRADIEWILGDLASVRWNREFDLVVMSGHAFQVLVTVAGGTVVRMTSAIETVDGDRVSFTHTFTSPDWDYPQISRSTLRFLNADSLSRFISDAGLTIEHQFGDWDQQPLTDASPEIITIARRA